MLERGDELGEMLRDVDKMADSLSVTVAESTVAAMTASPDRLWTCPPELATASLMTP